jgi:Domain of unknown function (DUF4150)
MGCTVFANDNGFFHKGSGGSGKAFPDVCLSPPPPPAGPVPIPYPNNLSASDLSDGSKTVKIQGEPTALEDASFISTSEGDEGGTQGGNVVTHKTKGKGYFKLWSFDVKVEGKGVDRHGDPMGQNCTSDPPGAVDIQAVVDAAWAKALDPDEPCTKTYVSDNDRPGIVKAQRDKVAGGPCWQCLSTSPMGNGPDGIALPNPTGRGFTPDHVPPIVADWYSGGCHDSDDVRKERLQSPDAVQPHCAQCSNGQGGFSSISVQLNQLHEALSFAASL